MRGKIGFLRIVEAFIAILIIAGVLGFIYLEKIQGPREEELVFEHIRLILKEISNNPDLRRAVLASDNFSLEGNISEIIPLQYDFDFRICNLNEACGIENPEEFIDREVYSDEVSVAIDLDSLGEEFNPKKIRLFVWEKN